MTFTQTTTHQPTGRLIVICRLNCGCSFHSETEASKKITSFDDADQARRFAAAHEQHHQQWFNSLPTGARAAIGGELGLSTTEL